MKSLHNFYIFLFYVGCTGGGGGSSSGGGGIGGGGGAGGQYSSQDEGPSSFEPPDVFCALGSLIVEGRLRAGGGRGFAEGPHVELPGRISRHKCSSQEYLVSAYSSFCYPAYSKCTSQVPCSSFLSFLAILRYKSSTGDKYQDLVKNFFATLGQFHRAAIIQGVLLYTMNPSKAARKSRGEWDYRTRIIPLLTSMKSASCLSFYYRLFLFNAGVYLYRQFRNR
jgi:hypothetical protein